MLFPGYRKTILRERGDKMPTQPFHIRVQVGHGPAGLAFVGSFVRNEPQFTPELSEALRLSEVAATFWWKTLRAASFSNVQITDADGRVIGD